MISENEIQKLNYDELIEVNRRVVARIKELREARNRFEIRQFRIGNSVEFCTTEGELITGIVARINKKTVGIITEEGEMWRVSPSMLKKSSKTIELETDQGILDFQQEQNG